MRHLILVMLFYSTAVGQQKDTSTAKIINADVSATVFTSEGSVFALREDTISVLMLVCDTSTFFATSTIAIVGENNNILRSNIWWQYGYEVCKYRYWIGGGRACITTTYLGENKKQIPKNIIVWATKELN